MMKKLIAVFCFGVIALNVNADGRYAYEYSSDNDDERRYERHYDGWRDDNRREDWYESESRGQRSFKSPRYQQSPIQIYMQPPQGFFRPHDKQSREDRRWRQRREEFQQQPQTPYYENPFYRDDTHW
jgi:hypothetical protein